MAFFKKFTDGVTDDLGRLGLGDKNERRDDRDGVGQYPPQGYGQSGQFQSPPPSQPGYYPPQQQQPYSSPPPHQQDYSSPPPPPRDSYPYPPETGARPPPPYTPPADKPPLPSGWTPRWDDHYQRWYCEFPT